VHVFAYQGRHACPRLHLAEIWASSPVAPAGCRKPRGSDGLAMDHPPGLVMFIDGARLRAGCCDLARGTGCDYNLSLSEIETQLLERHTCWLALPWLSCIHPWTAKAARSGETRARPPANTDVMAFGRTSDRLTSSGPGRFHHPSSRTQSSP